MECELIASFVLSFGLFFFGLVDLSEFIETSDDAIIISNCLLCALFYDCFFKSVKPGRHPGDFRSVSGTNLCYLFLVPGSLLCSQVNNILRKNYDVMFSHLTTSLIIVTVINQIALNVWYFSEKRITYYALLLVSMIPWVACGIFCFSNCIKWLDFNTAGQLYIGVIVGSLLQWIIAHKAPKSFSLAEGAIITQGFIIFVHAVCKPLFMSLLDYIKTRNPHVIETLLTNKVSGIDVFTQVAVMSAIVVLTIISICAPCQNSLCFYVLTFIVMGFFSLPVLYAILKQDFVTWMYSYIMATAQRRKLFMFWVIICVISVITVIITVIYQQRMTAKPTKKKLEKQYGDQGNDNESHKVYLGTTSGVRNRKSALNKNEPSSYHYPNYKKTVKSGITTTTRKVFHAIALATFLPGIYYDVPMLICASSCALVVFTFLECMRFLLVWPIGKTLNEHLNMFRDKQDQGPLLLTPIYLLAGCSLPLWFPNKDEWDISMFSGLIALGIGDSMASLVGFKFGYHKWPGTNKSIEGTTAFVCGCLVFIHLLHFFGMCSIYNWFEVYCAVILTSLLEAFTSQIDNLVLSLFMYCLLGS